MYKEIYHLNKCLESRNSLDSNNNSNDSNDIEFQNEN